MVDSGTDCNGKENKHHNMAIRTNQTLQQPEGSHVTAVPAGDKEGRSNTQIRKTHSWKKYCNITTASNHWNDVYKLASGSVNPLTPNVHYICRTAPLTSRRCILNIYSTNIRTEYFKHAA
jgi:hypothetical protein